MAVSTMGTDSSFEQLLEKGLTSASFPEFPNTVAWLPTTIMLAWESNCVVALFRSSLFPMSAVVAQTAEILVSRCTFGTARDLLWVDDPDPQEALVGVQPDFGPALVPMELDFSIGDRAQRSAAVSLFSASALPTLSFAPALCRVRFVPEVPDAAAIWVVMTPLSSSMMAFLKALCFSASSMVLSSYLLMRADTAALDMVNLSLPSLPGLYSCLPYFSMWALSSAT